LRSALGVARRELVANARPSPAFLEALSTSVRGLTGALAECESEVAALPESGRLALVRSIGEARSEMAVVAKLAAGSARFASLVREIDPGGRQKGLYGPGGTAPSGGGAQGGGAQGGGALEREA
jgi:hypothetical protein